MIQEFNSMPWHDAELKEIIINRSENDNIKLIVRWPEDYGSQCVLIEFCDCYALQANMHFGMVPPEFILEAECTQQSPDLDYIKKLWLEMGLDISQLNSYKITTNSTNSVITIFALGFQIFPLS